MTRRSRPGGGPSRSPEPTSAPSTRGGRTGTGGRAGPAPRADGGESRAESGTLRAARPSNPPGSLARLGGPLLVAGAIILFALVRVRVADAPLERDEGEYAYAGQLILQGIPPYQQAYNMKFPGTYYTYAAIMAAFGQTPSGIRYGLLLVNAATALVSFLIGRRLSGGFAGAIAAIGFSILSVDRYIFGVFAHATHFVLLPAMAGFYVLIRALDAPRIWRFVASGALLGISILMKQHAVFFLPLAALLVLRRARSDTREGARASAVRTAWLAMGAAVPLAVVCVVFLVQGVFGNFLFWTFQYAREYVSEVPLWMASKQLSTGFGDILSVNLPFWLLAGGGLIALWTGNRNPETRWFLTGLLLFSLLSTVPGLYFRQHYFILALPAVALLTGDALSSLARFLETRMGGGAAWTLAGALFAGLALTYVVRERGFLFEWNARDLSRTRYGSNPFIEAEEIAKYIKERTGPEDSIAVLGSEPEIYFYANRRSATGYIYTYALLEPQRFATRMRDEMIRQVEAAHPKYVVFAQINASWLPQPGSDLSILDWGNRYTQACYDLVGIADIYSFSRTNYLWDAQIAGGYAPKSKNLLFVFRRKSDAPCGAARQ